MLHEATPNTIATVLNLLKTLPDMAHGLPSNARLFASALKKLGDSQNIEPIKRALAAGFSIKFGLDLPLPGNPDPKATPRAVLDEVATVVARMGPEERKLALERIEPTVETVRHPR